MTSQHTEGPWQVSWSPDMTGYPCYSIHGMSGDQKRDQAVLDANARLIAAAPELLAALEDSQQIGLLRDELSENYARVNDRQSSAESIVVARQNIAECQARLRSIRQNTEVAIAKARGKA